MAVNTQLTAVQQYTRLENRLVLLAWLNSLFGYESNAELLEDTKRVSEGFGSDGHSYLYHHLVAREDRLRLTRSELAAYDENIRRHLEVLNRHRTRPVTLRYFQYLAALYTEVYLHKLFESPKQFIADLNEFIAKRSRRKIPGESPDDFFTEADLTKLAFWMATGSGKTLIMHLNYYQYLHYNRLYNRGEPFDNILLITPNEGLTEQHLAELEASGIPARRFELDGSRLHAASSVIQVIDIHKLVFDKRGSGVSVPVEAFEGRNLVFVDEGHKGSGGKVWRGYREELGRTGFTFEYSATFGQALNAAGKDELTKEYGKSIVFDYSYRYFYGDGFGKDFRILNLKEDRSDYTDTLLLGNLLSFYEQLRLFQDRADDLQPYNLEKPLWIFVGSTVNAVYTESGRQRSDVLTVVRFLHKVLQDRSWAVSSIEKLLEGRTGLRTQADRDVFENSFGYLRETGRSAEDLYEDMLDLVFRCPSGGALHICDISQAKDELGLRAGAASDYFGVIYIGDVSDFKKLVQAEPEGVVVEQDAVSRSIFEKINSRGSDIHILIGARKFIEGWNSWRVSSMGLLNIGRNEGSQIIQLFGRGVRLRGKDMCLKRSSALAEDSRPKHIELLETLNVFAVRADYMGEFRKYLEREGVETEPQIRVWVPVEPNKELLDRRLLIVPKVPEDRSFTDRPLLLEPDEGVEAVVDLSARAEVAESGRGGLRVSGARSGVESRVPAQSLELVDWQKSYFDILDYKERKGFTNLVIRPDVLRAVADSERCRLIADERVFQPRSFADVLLIQDAVTKLLCRYAEQFYRVSREQWEQSVMEYSPVDHSDPNLSFNFAEGHARYEVRFRSGRSQFVEAVERLVKDLDSLYSSENKVLTRINFDCHLYAPLFLEQGALSNTAEGETGGGLNVELFPPGLNASEARFVRDLRDFWNAEKDGLLSGRQVFLLRNLGRGKGIGFFQERGFYPDFILWVLEDSVQRIVFVEPHGMLHEKAYCHDEKAQLHERLPELAQKIGERSSRDNILLDAYIISATPFEKLRERYDDGNWDRCKFEQHHILFPDDQKNYIRLILLGNSSSAP